MSKINTEAEINYTLVFVLFLFERVLNDFVRLDYGGVVCSWTATI